MARKFSRSRIRYKCDLCAKVYKQECYLYYHMMTDHQKKCGNSPENSSVKNNVGDQSNPTEVAQKSAKCTVCSKILSSKASLRWHMRTHTKEKPFECEVCHKCFSMNCNLKRHSLLHSKRTSHSSRVGSTTLSARKHPRNPTKRIKTDSWKCNFCFKTLSNKYSLKTHLRIHTNEKPYKCEFCLKLFSDHGNAIKHRKKCSANKKYKCSVCFKDFLDESNFNQHMGMHGKENSFECEICHRFYSCKSSLKKHEMLHTKVKLHQHKIDYSMSSVKMNLSGRDTNVKGSSSNCSFCLKTFAGRRGIQKHLCTHTSEKQYECGYCLKSYPDQSSFECHMRYSGKGSSECSRYKLGQNSREACSKRILRCDFCSMSFSSERSLMKHRTYHTNAQIHLSKVSVKDTSSERSQNSQFNFNSDEIAKCEICSKILSCKQSLKLHMRTHTKEKPYQCDICLKWFSFKGNMVTHRGLHMKKNYNGREPSFAQENTKIPTMNKKEKYQCNTCHRFLPSKSHLMKHKTLHTKAKPWQYKTWRRGLSVKRNSLQQGVNARSSSKYNFRERRPINTSKKQFNCIFCHKLFSTKISLQIHERTHAEVKLDKVKFSREKSTTKMNLNSEGMYAENSESWNCEMCSKVLSSRGDLKEHMEAHAANKSYECEICHRLYSRESHLRSHKVLHNSMQLHQSKIANEGQSSRRKRKACTKLKRSTCNICFKTLSSKSHLSVHFRVHTKEKPYQCDVCYKCFSVSSNLKKHKQMHAKKISRLSEATSSSKSFSSDHSSSKRVEPTDEESSVPETNSLCMSVNEHDQPTNIPMSLEDNLQLCSSSSISSAPLPTKEDLHVNVETQACTALSGEGQLKRAIPDGEVSPEINEAQTVENSRTCQESSSISMEKSFRCEVCNKSPFSKEGLQVHLRTHTYMTFSEVAQQKTSTISADVSVNISCDNSPVVSNDVSKLLVSEKGSHKKSYPCNICEKVLLSKEGFEIHLRVHTKEKPYDCKICCKSFTSRSGLHRHKGIHGRSNSLANVKQNIPEKGRRNFEAGRRSLPAKKSMHAKLECKEKQYKCDTCSKSFSSENYLYYHAMLHLTDANTPNCNKGK